MLRHGILGVAENSQTVLDNSIGLPLKTDTFNWLRTIPSLLFFNRNHFIPNLPILKLQVWQFINHRADRFNTSGSLNDLTLAQLLQYVEFYVQQSFRMKWHWSCTADPREKWSSLWLNSLHCPSEHYNWSLVATRATCKTTGSIISRQTRTTLHCPLLQWRHWSCTKIKCFHTSIKRTKGIIL